MYKTKSFMSVKLYFLGFFHTIKYRYGHSRALELLYKILIDISAMATRPGWSRGGGGGRGVHVRLLCYKKTGMHVKYI